MEHQGAKGKKERGNRKVLKKTGGRVGLIAEISGNAKSMECRVVEKSRYKASE